MPPVTRSSKSPLLGPVLVTGGCGFLGYHLVQRLLADPECGPVHVLDLSPTQNIHAGAIYTQGSFADASTLSALLDRLQPVVIFHAASPNATFDRPRDFQIVNVDGTKTLLRLARESPHVRALVYTSTIDIFADPPHKHIKESHHLWPEHPWPWAGVSEYDRTKAIAHRLVLAANHPDDEISGGGGDGGSGRGVLKTAVIIPSHMWGVRDSQGLRVYFDTFADPANPLFQVGPGTNMVSCVEAGNCSMAHILAAKALIDPSRSTSEARVDGEAFSVTDGEDVNFWNHIRSICLLIRRDGSGGDRTKTWIIPVWVMALAVTLVKWALLLSTWGYVEPPSALKRNGLSYCTEDHTVDDSKARERLGYRPDKTRTSEEILAEAVEWERERRARASALQGQKRD